MAWLEIGVKCRKKVIQTSVKEEANKKMERLINNASTSELARHKLYEIWLEERLTEEKTSQAIWGKKKGFLEQLEVTYRG